jgi:hypothetical protein
MSLNWPEKGIVMKHLKKRITVINDGFAKTKKSAVERIGIARNRYYKKMSEKGWIPSLRPCSGNSFYHYETYVYLCKPKNNEERDLAIKDACELDFRCKNGVWSY